MSEYLFKAIRKDNGEWIEGFYGVKGEGTEYERHYIITSTFDKNASGYPFYFSDIEVRSHGICRYIGATDKNDKKIFEHDIIIDKDKNRFRIGFLNGSFLLIPISEIVKKTVGRKWFYEVVGEIEVIGNIFSDENWMLL